MIIGIPKEIKNSEYRVALTPSGAKTLVKSGHEIHLQTSAGINSGFPDEEYINAGAKIIDNPTEVWEKADLIIKVKEPQKEEFKYFREGLKIFTFLHLAAEPELTQELLKKKVDTIAYETIQKDNGELPLLTPMSEIAGKMSIQIGAQILEKHGEGKGILLGGVPGVEPAKVTIIGAGVVGINAAKIAIGMGADVKISDVNLDKLRFADEMFNGKLKTIMSNPQNIEKALKDSDLVIGAVSITGAKAPHIITEDMVKQMKEDAVIIDVSIDQGGSIETMDKITTLENPTFKKHNVIHYAVANIPSLVPRTSTLALTNATFPYIKRLADKGFLKTIKASESIAKGVNTYKGSVVSKPIANALGYDYKELSMLIGF